MDPKWQHRRANRLQEIDNQTGISCFFSVQLSHCCHLCMLPVHWIIMTWTEAPCCIYCEPLSCSLDLLKTWRKFIKSLNNLPVIKRWHFVEQSQRYARQRSTSWYAVVRVYMSEIISISIHDNRDTGITAILFWWRRRRADPLLSTAAASCKTSAAHMPIVMWCNEQSFSFRQSPKWVKVDRTRVVVRRLEPLWWSSSLDRVV